MDSQRHIAKYARDIAETVLDMTLERTLAKEELTIPQVAYGKVNFGKTREYHIEVLPLGKVRQPFDVSNIGWEGLRDDYLAQ